MPTEKISRKERRIRAEMKRVEFANEVIEWIRNHYAETHDWEGSLRFTDRQISRRIAANPQESALLREGARKAIEHITAAFAVSKQKSENST